MSGITLDQAEAKLTLWMAADDAVANKQAYSIAGRALTLADAQLISDNIDRWNRRVKNLTKGGISVRGVTPTE